MMMLPSIYLILKKFICKVTYLIPILFIISCLLVACHKNIQVCERPIFNMRVKQTIQTKYQPAQFYLSENYDCHWVISNHQHNLQLTN